jgi:hypothetical protein
LNSLNISKSLLIIATSPSEFEANFDNFSIKLMKILLISTVGFKLLVVSRSYSREERWNSSGNT